MMREDKILRKLSQMDERFSELEENTNNRFTKFEGSMHEQFSRQDEMISDIKATTSKLEKNMNNRFTESEERMQEQFAQQNTMISDIRATTSRIEKSMPKDIIAILKVIESKVDGINSDIAVE